MLTSEPLDTSSTSKPSSSSSHGKKRPRIAVTSEESHPGHPEALPNEPGEDEAADSSYSALSDDQTSSDDGDFSETGVSNAEVSYLFYWTIHSLLITYIACQYSSSMHGSKVWWKIEVFERSKASSCYCTGC